MQQGFYRSFKKKEYGEKVRSKDSPRVFSCLLFPLWHILLAPGRKRRKHYGLLVPPTDNVHLIPLLYGSGRGEFMDLVLEGVLSHPSACHGPCIFPRS